MSAQAEQLLSCAVTFHGAARNEAAVPATFDDARAAVATWSRVLLHEAAEAMQEPLAARPEMPYLHPVDVDTDEPGIVDNRENAHVLRKQRTGIPRMHYECALPIQPPPPPAPQEDVFVVSRGDAHVAAEREAAKVVRNACRKMETAERREAKAAERKEQLAAEDPEARKARLAEAKRKRDEKKEKAAAEAAADAAPPPPRPPPRTKAPRDDQALAIPDASTTAAVLQSPPPRRRTGKQRFFEHPLPHHRHMYALQHCSPSAALAPALLLGTRCEALEVIQGPPGTGKTRALVERISRVRGRVFLCAPTNVGAANLYERCVAEGLADECSLAIPRERWPLNVAVQSNDASRRIVCATVSARAGPMLDAQVFENVFVDEAAQCMEAWVWTLLRADVTTLVLAGDVHQLPALVSDSGRTLRHERSLMERLVMDLSYGHVTTLSVQNRMAPELLRVPNEVFYDNALVCGPHAPVRGFVEVHVVPNGREEACDGTSLRNGAEASCVAELARVHPTAAIIAPYTAQCRLLLAACRREVHTVDSFQGREADVVILSTVRDGTAGSLGFWNDARRAVVALTRARTRLILVVSDPAAWPADAALTRCVRMLQAA